MDNPSGVGVHPNVVVSSHAVQSKSPRKIYWIIASLFLIIPIIIAIIYFLKPAQNIMISKTDRGYPLHKSLEQTLSRSDKYYYLITEIDQAILEKDQNKKYNLLQTAFKTLNNAYKETNDEKILAILYQLKNYASSLRPYEEDDFIIKVQR